MKLKKIHRNHAPLYIREGIRALRAGNAREFQNREGILPNARGNTYYEADVGEDRHGGRGRMRVVGLFSPGGWLMRLYYTNDHYGQEWTVISMS